jgi:co-chaperonin GroES (HSP10)
MFNPVNRHILIDISSPPKPSSESVIVLPEDYTPEIERHAQVSVLKAAPDLRIDVGQGDKLIVDRSMIEEISIGDTIYNVILDNYVLGIIE